MKKVHHCHFREAKIVDNLGFLISDLILIRTFVDDLDFHKS